MAIDCNCVLFSLMPINDEAQSPDFEPLCVIFESIVYKIGVMRRFVVI